MDGFAKLLRAFEEWKEFQEKTPEAFEEHQALIITDKRVRYVLETADMPGDAYLARDSILGILSGDWDDVIEEYYATTKGIEE